jgi:serine phosphatase RsbU (regulator of sigma subunit)
LRTSAFIICIVCCLLFLSPSGTNAQNKADSLRKVLASAKESEKGELYIALSDLYRLSLPDTSYSYALAALKFSRKTGNKHLEGAALVNMGSYQNISGDHTQASLCFEAARKIGEELDDLPVKSNSYNGLALVQQNLGNFNEALDLHSHALEIRLKMNDIKGIGSSYNNMGDLYRMLDKNQLALDYLKKAEKNYQQCNYLNGLGSVYSNMGAVYIQLKDFTNAIHFIELSLSIRQKTGNKRGQVISLDNLAALCFENKEYARGLNYAKETYFKAREMGDKLAMITAMANMGKGFLELGILDSAFKYATMSVDTARKINNRPMQETSLLVLAAVQARKGDYNHAYQNLLASTNLGDSLNGKEANKKITELLQRISQERKDKEDKLKEAEFRKQKQFLYAGIAFLLLIAVFLLNRYQLKQKANKTLQEQHRIIAEKSKEIKDSIDYARKIQRAILPLTKDLERVFPEGFGLYKPKDVVSGDFYWFAETGGKALLAVADCTGHGVPGAFMSMLGSDKLSNAVHENKLHTPSAILVNLNRSIKQTLKQNESNSELRDGMDIALCSVDLKQMQMEYAGANRPLYLVRQGELITFNPTKSAVGGHTRDEQEFQSQKIALLKGDMFYMFTDGFADQFGGPKGKKFTSKRLRELLLSFKDVQTGEQEALLVKAFEDWKGSTEQVDDILVVGFRI